MSYTKHNYQSGDILTASDLNDMDDQIYELTEAIDGGEVGAEEVIVSSTQPTDAGNKIWIKESDETEVTVPTSAEFAELENEVSEVKNRISVQLGAIDAEWESGNFYVATGIEYADATTSRSGFIAVSPGEKVMIICDDSITGSFTAVVYEFASDTPTSSGVNERLVRFNESANHWFGVTNDTTNYIRIAIGRTESAVKNHVFVVCFNEIEKRDNDRTDAVRNIASMQDPVSFVKQLVFTRYGISRADGTIGTGSNRVHSPLVCVKKGDVLVVPDGYKYAVYYFNSSGYVSNSYDVGTGVWLSGEYVFSSGGLMSVTIAKEDDSDFTQEQCHTLNGKVYVYTDGTQTVGGVVFEVGHIDGSSNSETYLIGGNDYLYKAGWTNSATVNLYTTRYRTARITFFRKGTVVSIAAGYRFYIFKYASAEIGSAVTATQWYTGSYTFEEDTYARLVLDQASGTTVWTSWPALESILSISHNEDISASEYNRDMDDAVVWACGANTYVSGDSASAVGKKNNFSFVAIADVHGSGQEFGRFIDYANEHAGYIDAVMCYGDIVPVEPSQEIPWFENHLVRSVRPFLYTVGNHDVGQTGLSGITQETARNRYFPPIISKGFLSASDFVGEGKCSWFKDFPAYNIRVIAPFEYGNCYAVASGATNKCARRWWDSAGLQWIADTLYSTPEGYSVMIILHQSSSTNMDFIENNPFCTTKETSYAYNNWSALFMNLIEGNPLEDLVNAFVNSTNIERTYGCQSWTEMSLTASVSKDFSQRSEDGQFIAYFCGHTHANYVFRSATYPNQLCIGLPTGSSNLYQRKYGDILYSPNTRNRDNFCFIGIDTTAKKINLVKLGGQITTDMRERWYTSISYA